MGWTYVNKGAESARQYLERIQTWESEDNSYRVLSSSIKGGEAYFAVERTSKATGDRMVFATIFLLDKRTHEDGNDFGYKRIAGPYYYRCPNRILDLLSDTDNENELEWRNRCRRHNQALIHRDHLVAKAPIRFGNGVEYREFQRVSLPGHRNVFRTETGDLVRLRSEMVVRLCLEMSNEDAI